MGQYHTRNSVGHVTGGKVVMAGHIETLNVHLQPEQNETVAVDAWAKRVSDSSVWAHVRRNSNANSTATATVGIASELATLRDKAEEFLHEDPWLDSGLPIRFLERIEALFGAPRSDRDLDLYPVEAALLVLTPFLMRVHELRQAARLVEVRPGSPKPTPDAGPLRRSFEKFTKGHSLLLRRVQRVPEAESAVSWWLFHQWSLLPQHADGPESVRTLLKSLHCASSALERALAPELLFRCFHGLRLGPDVCSSKYLDRLAVDEPVRGHPDQRVREQRLTLVLSLAFGMAMEMAALPIRVAEHVGASNPVRLGELGRTLDEAHWSGLETLPVLQAECHHHIVTEGLKQHVSGVEQLLNRLHQTVQERIRQPVPDLPLRLSVDGLRTRNPLVLTRGRLSVQVPKRNPYFIGRADLLTELHSKVRDAEGPRTPIALIGTSGAGKTELAKEYVHRQASEYDVIWWVPSTSESQIRTAFSTIAEQLRLDSSDLASYSGIRSILESIQQGHHFGRWLLVFDNTGSREELNAYLPTGGNGNVIITSRDQSWSPKGVDSSLLVTEFSRDESIELLQRRGPRELTVAEADRVAEALGDLPLAVNQAAVWMKETGVDGANYVRQLTEKHQEYVHLLGAVDPEYPLPVAAAWDVSLSQLAVTNRAALQLLQMCSFMAPIPIPRDVFKWARNIAGPPELSRTLGDPALLGMAIRDIGRRSLAQIDHQKNTLSLHRLVALAVQAGMTAEEREALRHCTHQLLSFNAPEGSFTENQYSTLVSHVWTSRAWDCTHPPSRELTIRLCDSALERMEFQQVLQFGHEAYKVWSCKLDSEHRDSLRIVLRMSEALLAQGEFDRARELLESSRQMVDNNPD